MKVEFTKYDTVKINNQEIVSDKYIKDLKKGILTKKIENFNYKDGLFEYYTIEGEKYYIDISECNNDNYKKLLELIDIKQKLNAQNENIKFEKNQKEELLKLAEQGKIESEEVKEFYKKELKNQQKLINILKNKIIRNYKYKDLLKVIYPITIIIGVLIFAPLSALVFVHVSKLYGLIFLIYTFIEIFFSVFVIASDINIAEWLSSPYNYLFSAIGWVIINFYKNFIKNGIKNIKQIISIKKTIKHKLKKLEEYKPLNQEEINNKNQEKSTILTNYIEKNIDSICMSIAFTNKLNDEDKRKYKEELEEKLKEYREELTKDESIETKVKASQELMSYVISLREKITKQTGGERTVIEAPKLEVSTQAAVRTKQR